MILDADGNRPTPQPKPIDLIIDPRAPRQPIILALVQALNFCSEKGRIADPIAEYLAGKISADRLVPLMVEYGHVASKLPARMAMGKIAPEEAVAQGFACGAWQLTALAAMHIDRPDFAKLVSGAMMHVQAVLAQMGGPLEIIQTSFRTVTAAPPMPADDIGRNKPCACGSGKKFKLCCGRAG